MDNKKKKEAKTTSEEDNFCRKRLCTVVSVCFVALWGYISLDLFYSVNLTSSWSFIPKSLKFCEVTAFCLLLYTTPLEFIKLSNNPSSHTLEFIKLSNDPSIHTLEFIKLSNDPSSHTLVEMGWGLGPAPNNALLITPAVAERSGNAGGATFTCLGAAGILTSLASACSLCG